MEQQPFDGILEELKKDWIKAIEDLVKRKETEQFFLDFKRTEIEDYSWKTSLENNDRSNLAKAISWFGNSEWWILIWWVNCTSKNKYELKNIKNPDQFSACINSEISRLTVPQHNAVNNIVIKKWKDKGYVITIIPKSYSAPHEVIKEHRYYMRAWDSFLPIPYSVLSWMFGKRPQPNVTINFIWNINHKLEEWFVVINFGIMLMNIGMWIAKDIYLNTLVWWDEHLKISTQQSDKNFRWYYNFGVEFNLISDPDYKLWVEQRIQPLIYNVWLKPPFTKEFYMKIVAWSEGQPVNRLEITLSPDELNDIYNYGKDNQLADDLCNKFLKINKH